ncbi:TetR/AcrR family transcriptional regulator [Nocardia sp. NPDC019302]|uniref:TetR/AcrR family transcriptional regulator n=1 Tax=Nocardia sp. NPDC019302 TaxID=3154592 RepID=UPI0033FC3FF7
MAFTENSSRKEPAPLPEHLAINEPRQRRSRETWRRILDAGVALVEADGYEGFTIAALSEASGANPRAIYERAASKDALFLAVYEHKMAQMAGQRDRLFGAAAEPGLAPGETVRRAVTAVLGLFTDNAAFLRAVIAIAPRHPVVFERGRRYTAQLGELFAAALEPLAPATDPAAARLAFRTVYAMALLRTVQGPEFLEPVLDFDAEVAHLSQVVERYLRVELSR